MKKVFLIVLMIVLFVAGGILIYFGLLKKAEPEEISIGATITLKRELKIVDEDSISRPYAVMINNHSKARANHAGLQDAYIVYEAIVEGGLTRMMAIFKDKDTARIGSVRSSRHYFLDYALENDAIYVHFG